MATLPDSKPPRRVIVCGPMTGVEFYNCAACESRAMHLRARGHQVITPIELDRENGFFAESGDAAPEGWADLALLRTLKIIQEWATTIDLLPWWSFSGGTDIELRYGRYLKREIWYPAAPTAAEEALRLVHGPKQDAYGDPWEFFTAVGLKWGVSAERAARMMEQFKRVRLEWRYTRNDDVDRHGYALIAELIAKSTNGPTTPLPQGGEHGDEESGCNQ